MTRDDARARKTVVGTRPWTLSGLETWIDEVAATADNDLRAHRITLTYSRLAEHLDKLIHGAEAASRCHSLNEAACNANWFHFATWANRTVTHNISSERMPSRVNSGVAAPLRRRLTPAVLQPQASQGQRVGQGTLLGPAIDLRRHVPHAAGVLEASAQEHGISQGPRRGLDGRRQDHRARRRGVIRCGSRPSDTSNRSGAPSSSTSWRGTRRRMRVGLDSSSAQTCC